MTDPVPEITDLQNRLDNAQLRAIATAYQQNGDADVAMKHLLMYVQQLGTLVYQMQGDRVKPLRLVVLCACGCFLGSLAGVLLATWLR